MYHLSFALRFLNTIRVTLYFTGAMFAGISCIQAVSTCVGAVGFDVMYSSTVNLFSGITFLVMAGCFLLSALFAL